MPFIHKYNYQHHVKNLLLLLLTTLSLTISLSAQPHNNYFEVGAGRGFHNNGDGRAWSFSNEYKHTVGKGRFLLGGAFSAHHSSADNIGVNFKPNEPTDYPLAIVDQHESYPFPGFVPGEPFYNQRGIILDTKTEQHLYLHFDVFLTLRLASLAETNRWECNLALGPGINYISQSYITELGNGTYESSFYPPTNITIVVPYYKRLLTVGGTFKSDVLYKFRGRSAIGLSGRTFWNINADAVFSYALLWRVGF